MFLNSKLSERLMIAAPGEWLSASTFSRFVGVGYVELADGGESVTVQLRKATDAAGTNAANFGTAKTTTHPGTSPAANDTIKAAADGHSPDLGKTAGGLQFTHVSVTVTHSSSPESAYGMLIAGDARSSTDTLAGVGDAG